MPCKYGNTGCMRNHKKNFANEIRYPLCLRKGDSRRIIFVIRAIHTSHFSPNNAGLDMFEGIIEKIHCPFLLI